MAKRGAPIGSSNARHKPSVATKPRRTRAHASDAGRRIDWIQRNCIVPRGTGAGKPVRLLPAQSSFIETVNADGILSAGLSCPRGNGKTGLLAMIVLAELFTNPWSPDIGIAATTLQQSSRPSGVYGVARRLVQLNGDLAGRTLVYRGTSDPHLSTPFNDGVLAPVSTRDPDGLLGLSSSLLIADEFGAEHWDDERWGNMVQSGGKRGGDSRIIGISTPNSKESAMYTLRQRVMAGIASPSVAWVEHAAEPDADPADRGQWYRANFALDHFLHISALEADLADRPAWMFAMMRLGLWQDVADDGWLGVDGPGHWDATTTTVHLDPGEPCFVGVDKSMRDDCSAVAVVQRLGDRWQTQVEIFAPTDGVIDHARIRDHIRALCKRYQVATVAYDPRFFVEGAADLEGEGLPMIEVPQTHQRMVPAYSALHHMIVARELDHDDDPQLRNHVLKAVPQIAANGGFTLAKNKSRSKIDAVVAIAIALSGSGDLELETETTPDMLG